MITEDKVNNAEQNCQPVTTEEETLDPAQRKVAQMLISADSVEYSPPRWLLAPYIQRGKGTLIQADPGTGKTAFACAIAAAVSTATPICGLPVQTPGNVLMLSVEDDPGLLRGRIEANGGDLKRVHFLDGSANLTMNSPELETAIKMCNAKLLILDPLQAFLGSKIDMHRANETRPALAQLFAMCDRNDCACMIIAHLGKSVLGKSPVNQSLGSVDIPAAMRSVIQIVRNPDNDQECLAVHIKSSNAAMGKTMAFVIGDRGGIQWHGFSDFGMSDLAVVPKRKAKGIPYEQEPLVQVFCHLAAQRPGGGFWSYDEIKRTEARLLGYTTSESTRALIARLDDQFLRELTRRDGIVVVAGQKQGGVRGIRITPYQHPQMYQTHLNLGEGQ